MSQLEGEMDIEEARQIVRKRFSETESEWWHQGNEETFQHLLRILEPYMRPELAIEVLRTAFWATADEYGD